MDTDLGAKRHEQTAATQFGGKTAELGTARAIPDCSAHTEVTKEVTDDQQIARARIANELIHGDYFGQRKELPGNE